jgi:outer membrane protein OmpA-like peptidoglycan-associated protein
MIRATVRTLAVAAVVVGVSFAAATRAQEVKQSASIVSSDVANQVSAFSYKEGPESDLAFTGTTLAPAMSGEAEVEFQDGRSEIRAKVEKLPEQTSLGPYTLYILWAVAPDGRATNLGAFDVSGGKGKLKTSYSGSQFALIITAEPHYAVSVPGSAVVAFNVGKNVKGEETKISTLASRADYSDLKPIAVNDKTSPSWLVGAEYAVAIAAAAGAEQYAPDAYSNATSKLDAAKAAQSSKKGAERKQAPLLAREATQAGEDARRAGMAGQTAAAEQAQRAAAAEAAAAAERERQSALASEAAANDLRNRLNSALPTRKTERGLVSEIGGVEFATGTANLNVAARESLAKFAGVCASYPSLRYNVEGHTDNTGSEEKNRELSLKRAISVRDYLIGQGLPASSIDVAGLGPENPVSDNATAGGRAANRRVEIVLTGGPLASK